MTQVIRLHYLKASKKSSLISNNTHNQQSSSSSSIIQSDNNISLNTCNKANWAQLIGVTAFAGVFVGVLAGLIEKYQANKKVSNPTNVQYGYRKCEAERNIFENVYALILQAFQFNQPFQCLKENSDRIEKCNNHFQLFNHCQERQKKAGLNYKKGLIKVILPYISPLYSL